MQSKQEMRNFKAHNEKKIQNFEQDNKKIC